MLFVDLNNNSNAQKMVKVNTCTSAALTDTEPPSGMCAHAPPVLPVHTYVSATVWLSTAPHRSICLQGAAQTSAWSLIEKCLHTGQR